MAWPKVTIGALLLIAPLGAVTGRRMRAIRRACSDAKAINSELLSRLQDPFLKISLGIRIAVFPWHCPADGHQAGIVGVDHRCGNLDNSRCFIVRSCRASQWIVGRT